ncbi:MAG: hypothetical protein WA578_17430, partial [Candidatus Sulfotelmatobacter sp.]
SSLTSGFCGEFPANVMIPGMEGEGGYPDFPTHERKPQPLAQRANNFIFCWVPYAFAPFFFSSAA